MIHPRHMTNDELATELENLSPYHVVLPLFDEITRRLVGETRAASMEDGHREPDLLHPNDRKVLDLLEEYGLDDIETLEAEIDRCNVDYGLNDFLNSEEWHQWDSHHRTHDMAHSDPLRYDRCAKYAGYGCEGSTHAEIIADWRSAVDESGLGMFTKWRLHAEIDGTESWHKRNGSLNSVIN